MDGNHKQEGLTMNRYEWYLGRKIRWTVENEEKVQEMGVGY